MYKYYVNSRVLITRGHLTYLNFASAIESNDQITYAFTY